MLKRPSSRRRSESEGFEINLVPMLDALVTMISFLLFSMSFLALVSMDSPAPIASSKDMEEKLTEKPLQLTLTMHESEVEIWSPFDKVASKKIPNVAGAQAAQGAQGAPTALAPDAVAIHNHLLEIKKSFPREKKIIFVPHSNVNYDVIVLLMDTVREIEKTDPPQFVLNEKTKVEEPLKDLFPEVVFGNLLGESAK